MNQETADRLTHEVDALIAKIDRALGKRVQHFSFSHDDGNPEIDASDPSMDDTDAENSDDDNGNGNPGNDVDDDEDDEDNVSKALDGTGSETYLVNQHSRADRPGGLKHSSHPPNRHKFEALVDHIKNDKGITRSEAMSQARMNFPEVYRSFQRHTNGVESTFKSAPPTFQDLVNAEMRKGCNSEVAAQRVAQLYGYNAFNNDAGVINKRAWSLESEFHKRASDVWGNSAMDRCEALRETRLANPRLFSAMQRA